MELEYLKEFVVMAQHEDLSEAADELFISPSTLSRHIRSIEEYLNLQLFERSSRSMKLNHYGEIYLGYANQIMQLSDASKTVLSAEIKKSADVLRIASLDSMDNEIVSDLLETFTKEQPQYQINLIRGESRDNWNRLNMGISDFIFVLEIKGFKETDDYIRIRIAFDELVAVVSQDHPLAKRGEPVNAHLLRNEPLCLLDKSNYIYELCLEQFENELVSPHIVATSFLGSNLIGLAENGLGIALLLRKEAEHNISDKAVILPFEPMLEVSINLICSASRPMRKIDREFLDCVKKFQE